jgi:hypothetical protein
MCGLRNKTDGRIEKRNQSHAPRSQQQGNKLIAHKAYQYVESLYATKDAGIFQYVAIAAVVALVFHISN